MRRTILFITLLVYSGFCGDLIFAQIKTLEAYKRMAIENSAKTKNSALDIEAAQQQKKAAFTKYFPDINASGMIFKANDPLINTGIPIPQIGVLPIELIDDGLIATITALQPVFAGGQIINSNKLAQLAIDAAKLQNNLSIEAVLQKTEQCYWQIVSIKEHIKSINSIDTLLARIHVDVKLAVEVGVVSTNDLLKVELQQNELASNQLKLENLLILAKMELAQHVGMPMDSAAQVDVRFFDQARAPTTTYYINNEEALAYLSSYKLLEKSVEAAKTETRLKRGEYLPKVGVGYSYTSEDMISKRANHGVVFASVSIPLSGWWEGSHDIKRKKINERKVVHEKEYITGQLQLKMQQAWNSLVEAEQQIYLAESAVKQSAENLKINRDYYNAGTSQISDLLDAQSIHKNNLNRLINTQINYKLKLSEYLFATGRVA